MINTQSNFSLTSHYENHKDVNQKYRNWIFCSAQRKTLGCSLVHTVQTFQICVLFIVTLIFNFMVFSLKCKFLVENAKTLSYFKDKLVKKNLNTNITKNRLQKVFFLCLHDNFSYKTTFLTIVSSRSCLHFFAKNCVCTQFVSKKFIFLDISKSIHILCKLCAILVHTKK